MIEDNNDGTPQAQPEWATGPVRDLTDPRNYLPDDPTEDELRLADALDPGSINVHLAKVAIRGWGHALWIRGADRRDKLARWLARVVITAALANVAAIAYHWLSAHDAQIVAAAEARAAHETELEYRRGVNQRLDQLEQSVRLIQRALMRLSGSQPLPDADGAYPWPNASLPDHFSAWGSTGQTGADVVGDSGRVRLQRPKLQNWQFRITRWHSRLLEQISPQTFGVMTGTGGCGIGLELQPVASEIRNTMTRDMGMLYPWLHHNVKEIAP